MKFVESRDEIILPREEEGNILEILGPILWTILFPDKPYPDNKKPIYNFPIVPEANGSVMYMSDNRGSPQNTPYPTDDSGSDTIYGGVENDPYPDPDEPYPGPDEPYPPEPSPYPEGGSGGSWAIEIAKLLSEIANTASNFILAKELKTLNKRPPDNNKTVINKVTNNIPSSVFEYQPRSSMDYEPPLQHPQLPQITGNLSVQKPDTSRITQKLDKAKQESEEELKKSLERNEMITKGITNMVLTLAKMAENPKPLRSMPYKFPASETYTPQTAAPLVSPLDPSRTGADRPLIQEDQRLIQDNLSYSKKPLTTDEMAKILANDYARMKAAQQQQQLSTQQRRTLEEQERLARAQRLAMQQDQLIQSQRMAGSNLFSVPLDSSGMGEKSEGPKSDYPPMIVDNWPFDKAYSHWLYGQGQPIQVPFRSLNFSGGHFRKDSQAYREISQSISEAKQKGYIVMKDIDLKDQGFEFNPSNISDFATYGNIVVDAKGALTVDPHGNWQFDGQFFPGIGVYAGKKPQRGDIFNFNPATYRSLPAEIATNIIHTLPGTLYHIYFTKEQVPVIIRYKAFPVIEK